VPRIALNNVEIGMQLSRPVFNSSGAFLIDRGVEITEEMIRRLFHAGVSYVFVEGRPDATLEKELSALEKRFSKCKDNARMATLRRLIREHMKDLYS
jgi:hypothetical protein